MKKLILAFATVLMSQMAFASNKITVSVPEGAQTLIVKAFQVPVDTCNGHGLLLSEYGSNDEIHLGIISTKMACFGPGFKLMDLTAEMDLDGQEEVTLSFRGEDFPELKIEYK